MRTSRQRATTATAWIPRTRPHAGLMPVIRQLRSDEWRELQDLRLAALLDSPDMFLATHEKEILFDQARWHAEFERGDWYCGSMKGRAICLVGVTREGCGQNANRYIEYMWVSPDFRHSGVGRHMLTFVLDRLRAERVSLIFLWVLDGNYPAVRLYEQLGFTSTGDWQPLPDRPKRSEHKMEKRLD